MKIKKKWNLFIPKCVFRTIIDCLLDTKRYDYGVYHPIFGAKELKKTRFPDISTMDLLIELCLPVLKAMTLSKNTNL